MKCRECGAEYDVQMPRCPECGFPNEEYRQPQDLRQVSDNAQAVDYFNDTAESKMGKFMNPKVIGAIAGGVVLLCVALFFIFHDGNKGKVKDLCVEFGNAMKVGNIDQMKQLYPAISNNDELVTNINLDNIDIEKNKDVDGYIATIGDGKSFICKKGGDDKFYIHDSKGIYTFDDYDLKLPKKTGQFNAALTDQENLSRLNDKGFGLYLNRKAEAYVKEKVTIRKEGKGNLKPINLIVRNGLDIELNSDDYKVTFKRKNGFYEFYGGDKYYTHEVITGFVGALSTEEFSAVAYDLSDSPIVSMKMDLTMPTEKLLKAYRPTGHEFDDYMKSKEEVGDEKVWVESMLPRLQSERLTEADLAQYDSDKLKLLRNAIFAKHGYIFKMEVFSDFFSQYDWYKPVSSNVTGQLNSTETYNVNLIKSME